MDDRPPIDDARRDAPPRRRSIARNVATLLASQGATWVLGTALVLVQPRLLGPTDVGRLQLATSIWAIATVIGTWGSANVLLVEVARDHAQARPLERAVRRMRTAGMLALAPAVALFAAIAGYSRGAVVVLAVVGVSAVLQAVATSRRTTLLALEEMGAVGRTDVVVKLLNVAVVLCVLVLGADAFGVATVGVGVAVVSLLLFGRALARRTADAAGTAAVTARHRGRGLVRAGTSYFLVEAGTTVYLQIDAVVISLLVGEEQLGWYSVANLVFASLLFAPTIAMSAMFPTFARGHATDPEENARLLERVVRVLLVLGTWFGVGTVVTSRSLTDLVFGDRFHGAAPVLAIYGLVTIVSYLTIALGTYAVTTDRAAVWSKLVLVSIVLTVALDLVLVPVMRDRYDNGALAGPTSYLVTEVVQLVVGVALLARHLLNRRTMLHALRVVVAGGALYAVGSRVEDRFVLVPAIAGTVAFLVVLVVSGALDADDRAALRAVRARRGGRRGAA